MTLTPEQLDAAIVMIGHFDASEREQAIMRAMYADLAAMRQPITAEALVAAGWGHDECWFDLPGSVVAVQQRDETTFDVYVIDGDISKQAEGANTMYDLRELVRLLGGAK
jgi:hypothetical protein